MEKRRLNKEERASLVEPLFWPGTEFEGPEVLESFRFELDPATDISGAMAAEDCSDETVDRGEASSLRGSVKVDDECRRENTGGGEGTVDGSRFLLLE